MIYVIIIDLVLVLEGVVIIFMLERRLGAEEEKEEELGRR